MVESLLKKEDRPLANLEAWGNLAKQSGIVPYSVNKYQAMAIIQTGKEIGLQPFQSLRSMSFIKGRLTMAVQLQLALAERAGVKIKSLEDGDGYCKVVLKRDDTEIPSEYTREDAKRAKLYTENIGKKRADGSEIQEGSWEKYEKQMLRWRAIGDALRLIAPDIVMGLLSPEEAESIEPMIEPLNDYKEIMPDESPTRGIEQKGSAEMGEDFFEIPMGGEERKVVALEVPYTVRESALTMSVPDDATRSQDRHGDPEPSKPPAPKNCACSIGEPSHACTIKDLDLRIERMSNLHEANHWWSKHKEEIIQKIGEVNARKVHTSLKLKLKQIAQEPSLYDKTK